MGEPSAAWCMACHSGQFRSGADLGNSLGPPSAGTRRGGAEWASRLRPGAWLAIARAVSFRRGPGELIGPLLRRGPGAAGPNGRAVAGWRVACHSGQFRSGAGLENSLGGSFGAVPGVAQARDWSRRGLARGLPSRGQFRSGAGLENSLGGSFGAVPGVAQARDWSRRGLARGLPSRGQFRSGAGLGNSLVPSFGAAPAWHGLMAEVAAGWRVACRGAGSSVAARVWRTHWSPPSARTRRGTG